MNCEYEIDNYTPFIQNVAGNRNCTSVTGPSKLSFDINYVYSGNFNNLSIPIIVSIILIIHNFADYDLVKMGYDCKSKQEKLENELGESRDHFGHAWECANACQKIVGCNFFSYHPISYSGLAWCWWKKTETANCSEGWVHSRVKSFFAMISMSDLPSTDKDYDYQF